MFVTEKEIKNRALSLELRAKGIITAPGGLFVISRRKEIDRLLARGIYDLITHNTAGLNCIFGSRIVDEVKGKEAIPFEKSRLVVQAFNNKGKDNILTALLTIQKISQRLILVLAPALFSTSIKLALRDITQAYVQLTSLLKRLFFCLLPKEIRDEFPSNILLRIIRPLYGITESGTYWFNIY